MGTRLWMGMGWVLLAGGLAPAPPAMAQDDADAHIGCFRGRPLPDCKSFWIVEIQGVLPVFQTSRGTTYGTVQPLRREAFSSQIEWNVGHMVNASRTWALGGELTLGSGNDNPLTGMRARARRWVGSNVSVEGEAGVLWSNADHATGSSLAGPTLGMRLNIRDQGAFFVRWDLIPIPETYGPGGFHDPGGAQHALLVGATAGSVPALAATGALGLAMLVVLSTVSFD